MKCKQEKQNLFGFHHSLHEFKCLTHLKMLKGSDRCDTVYREILVTTFKTKPDVKFKSFLKKRKWLGFEYPENTVIFVSDVLTT